MQVGNSEPVTMPRGKAGRTHWFIWRSQIIPNGLKVMDHYNVSGWMMIFQRHSGIFLATCAYAVTATVAPAREPRDSDLSKSKR